MRTPTLVKWFAAKPSVREVPNPRAVLRVGIPKILNVWSTHQFWVGFLTALGINPRNIVFSSDNVGGTGSGIRQGSRDGGLLLSG
jgi:hypothetical protein